MTAQEAATSAIKGYYQPSLFRTLADRRRAAKEGDYEMVAIYDSRIQFTRDCIKACKMVADTGMSPAECFAFYGLPLPKGTA